MCLWPFLFNCCCWHWPWHLHAHLGSFWPPFCSSVPLLPAIIAIGIPADGGSSHSHCHHQWEWVVVVVVVFHGVGGGSITHKWNGQKEATNCREQIEEEERTRGDEPNCRER